MANATTHAIESQHSGLMSSQTKWLDLPIPITELILERLPLSDYIRFSSVCKHWYATKKQHLKRYSPFTPLMQKPMPWLIPCLYTDEEENTIPVFCSSEKKCYHFTLPENETHTYGFATSHGWFFFLRKHRHNCIYLFNPVSKSQIELPPLMSTHVFYNLNGVLSTSPLSPDCVALIFDRYGSIVYLCWLGQKQLKWTLLDVTYDDEDPYLNVWYCGAYCNGKFYCIKNCFFVIDSIFTTPTIHVLHMDCSQLSSEEDQRQTLVECDGEILMVVRIYDLHYEMVRRVEVFRAEFSKMTWVRVKSLGDSALFMGVRGSLCVSASAVGCRSNSVYYMNRMMERRAVGAFDMGTMEWSYDPSFPFNSNSLRLSQFEHWFLPSLEDIV